MLLAAQTETEATDVAATIATYSSERDRALVRIARMSRSHQYQLNLVTSGDHPPGPALVALGGISTSLPFILTDEDGSAAFTYEGDVAWADLSVLVSFPFARIAVDPPLRDGLELRTHKSSVLVSLGPGGCSLMIRGEESVGHVVLLSSERQGEIFPVRNGAVALPHPLDSDTREILLFP
jgi:hypothetical protein